ncbi:MAG: ABC transporter permease [Candidatus Carbobacillus sp.]|nr:ABC transporter permease [Candidatus Carbobacillus sp.]
MFRISWMISWNALRLIWRDPRSLILLLLMPTILTFILGISLKGVMDGEKRPPFDAWLIEMNAGESGLNEQIGQGQTPASPSEAGSVLLAYPLVEEALMRVPKDTGMNLVPGKSLSEVETWIKKGQSGVAVTVANASLHLTSSGSEAPVLIGLWVNPDEALVSLTAELVLRRVTGMLNRSLHQLPDVSTSEVIFEPSGVRSVGAMSYYAAAMGVMFMVFTAMTRARAVALERKTALYTRLMAAPLRPLSVGMGYIGAGMLVMWVQWLLLMVFSAVMFQVDWVNAPWIALIALVYSLAWSGIALALATWTGEERVLDLGGVLLSLLLAAFSGSMYPLYLFPDTLLTLAKLTPNYWALKSMLDILSGIEPRDTFGALGVLFFIGLIGMVLGWMRLGVRG